MGTERHELFRRECYCGSGEIIINHCMLDHPWVGVSQGWFEATIYCENCRSKFEILEQGSNFVMVDKSDIKAQKELCSELNRRCDNMMAWPEVKELIKQFELILNNQRSVAACYRFINEYFRIIESISTFRKHWHSASDWIKRNLGVGKLETVMNLLNEHNEKISEELLEIDKLRMKCQQPLPIVGNPIYNTSPYQSN